MVSSITDQLARLSITAAQSISHAPAPAPQEWKTALSASTTPFLLTKTLLLKPKAAASVPAWPVMVVAADSSDLALNALAKDLGYKEMRVGQEDYVKEHFQVTDKAAGKLIAQLLVIS
jgi:prolyl-tRNA editing enzyme YbaK/EbsC (Cys-tRNA(Pro) deacylase)